MLDVIFDFFYSKFVNFEECGYDIGQISCKEYLKTNKNILTLNFTSLNLTTNRLNLNSGSNFYDKSLFKLNDKIKKGFVPMIKISGISISLPFKNYNETFPDYVGLKYVASNEISNITIANLLTSSKKAFTNINIMFKFNQTTYLNYSVAHQFNSFGQFSVYIYSLIGGNIFALTGPVNIQCVDNYTKLSNYFNHLYN